jgi:glycosyltransferase involved in cell wall biosynthesis
MNSENYTVVIPYYNDYTNLCLLLQDIARTNQRFRPEKILIVNDGSTDNIFDIPDKYNIDLLPEISLITIDHSGPKEALIRGLNSVETDFSIVLHSDARLLTKFTNSYVHKDVLSVLYYHCSDADDAISVSCFSLHSYGIDKSMDYITGGFRSIDTTMNKTEMVVPYYNYRFKSLVKDSLSGWFRVFSVSSNIFTLNMNIFREVGKFDDSVSNHRYFLDDLFAKSRSKGYHVYFTYDTVIFHNENENKPEKSLAIEAPEDWSEFCEKWAGDKVWTEMSLYE